jgi:hypothetical protein
MAKAGEVKMKELRKMPRDTRGLRMTHLPVSDGNDQTPGKIG